MKGIQFGYHKFKTIDESKCICDAVKLRNGGNSSAKIERRTIATGLVNLISATMQAIVGARHHLMELYLRRNVTGHSRASIVAIFLATDPPRKALDLEKNNLDDKGATLPARALRTNSNLQQIFCNGNAITSIGRLAFPHLSITVSNLQT